MTAIEPVKILLFYKFTPLADPEAIRLWQRTLCENLELTGRIIISKDGINGTVGGSLSAIKNIVEAHVSLLHFEILTSNGQMELEAISLV